jgi:hypothetical protein
MWAQMSRDGAQFDAGRQKASERQLAKTQVAAIYNRQRNKVAIVKVQPQADFPNGGLPQGRLHRMAASSNTWLSTLLALHKGGDQDTEAENVIPPSQTENASPMVQATLASTRAPNTWPLPQHRLLSFVQVLPRGTRDSPGGMRGHSIEFVVEAKRIPGPASVDVGDIFPAHVDYGDPCGEFCKNASDELVLKLDCLIWSGLETLCKTSS